MNILFLAHNINIHSMTGDAIHVRELAENLAALGNHVTLVAGSNPDIKLEENSVIKTPGVNVQYIREPTFTFSIIHEISTLSFCLKIWKKNPPDIIYERNFSCKIGVLLSTILGIPLIVEINGLADEEAKMQGKKDFCLRRLAGKVMRRILFRKAKRIVSVTPGIKEQLIKSYSLNPAAIEVIPNGANINIFKPIDQDIVKAELGLKKQYKYVCFVGNLTPWQGVEYLIEAAPLVIKNAPEARFLIVGDGMMYESLQNLVKEFHLENHFYFTGRIPYDVVPKYINASDICVAPFIRARNEKIGLSPLKLYEYLACGKPVIGSNINGVGNFLEKSNAGISFNTENVVEFSNVLINLIKDHKMREKMGRNARNIALEKYSWNNTAKSIIYICEKLLKEEHKR